MKITEVKITYGHTHNLGNYSNVRPEITLTAALDEGDSPSAVEIELLRRAQVFVYEAIDEALEGVGKAAEYSTDPRYMVIRSCSRRRPDARWGSERPEDQIQPPERVLYILPSTVKLANEHKAFWAHLYDDGVRLPLNMRHHHARAEAARYLWSRPEYRIVELYDDQLYQLPAWLTTPPAKDPEPAEPEPASDPRD